MLMLSRLLSGLFGFLFLALGAGLWLNTGDAAANLGLVDLAAAGFGTVRADIAGFFLGGGLILVVAAGRRDPSLLWPVQLLVLIALLGRTLTLVIDGPVAAGVPSMGVELVILVLLFWCKRVWATQPD
ncbi:MAG: hypothetical protein P8M13_10250 [Luminiphilus sp.]|nr:hypothetical protein [Luminiphilus sp.]MDG2443620.1 hypothetical protein [Luminiphilus sp.]